MKEMFPEQHTEPTNDSANQAEAADSGLLLEISGQQHSGFYSPSFSLAVY